MSFITRIVVLAVLVAAFLETATALPCSLCGSSLSNLPTKMSYQPTSGKTCMNYYVTMSNAYTLGSAQCNAQKAIAESKCCGSSPVAPTPAPQSTWSGPVGSEPSCPICGTMEYPGKPYQIITARYVGTYTCDQLYSRGLNGLIPEAMCGVLQDYAAPICGCGQYNPQCIADKSKCYSGSTYSLSRSASPPSPTPALPPTVEKKPTTTTQKDDQKLTAEEEDDGDRRALRGV